MVVCPDCGTDAATLVKSWPVSFGKQEESENKPQFYIGIFECPECKVRFRSRLASDLKLDETVEAPNVKTLVERIKLVREGLMETLRTLHEKMKTLETERVSLMVEIEELKKVAESRAASLESEITQLREEMRSLKELLGRP